MTQQTVVDRFSGRKIIIKEPLKLIDTLETIKKKIFISYDLSDIFITPELMAISDGKQYISTENTLKTSVDLNKLVVFNLLEEISDYILKNLQTFTVNNPPLKKLFSSLKKSYVSLTENTLKLAIEWIVSKNVTRDVSPELKIWQDKTRALQKDLLNSFKQEQITRVKKSSFIKKNNEGEEIYSVGLTHIHYKIADEPIDLLKVIKEFKLDSNIPLMYIKNPVTKEPIVKIYKNFPPQQIKEWLAPDELKLNAKDVLVLKLRTSKNIFSSVNISAKDRKITNIYMKRVLVKESETTLEEAEKCTKCLTNLLKQLRSIFPKVKIDVLDTKLTYSSIVLTTIKKVNLQKLLASVKEFEDIFEVIYDIEKDKSNVKLRYKPFDATVLFRKGEVEKNGNTVKTTNITVTKLTKEQQIKEFIKDLSNLLETSDVQENVLEFVDFELIEVKNDLPEEIVRIPKLELKKLKEQGAILDVVGCQKSRQPIISSDEQPLKDSYALNFEGNRYICKNPEYPFPGFTSKNSPCCFKKDQRGKPVYKRNIGVKQRFLKSFMSDNDIIKKGIITTDKDLEDGRLGTLDEKFGNILSKDFLRFGVLQNKDSMLNCLNTAFKTNIGKETIKKYREDNPNNSYTIVDVLSAIFDTNIIIFLDDEKRIKCKENAYMPFKHYVFLIKRERVYELIVLKQSQASLQRFFTKDHEYVTKIKDIYKMSCIVKYTGTPNPPMTILELVEAGISIKGQITNTFGQTMYLNTNIGLIPVVPFKSIPQIKQTNFEAAKLNAFDQYELLSKTDIDYVKPVGKILNKKGQVSGFVTKSALIIPVIPGELRSSLPTVFRQFDEKIDEILFAGKGSVKGEFSYILDLKFFKELYERLRYTLSIALSENKDLKENMKKILEGLKYFNQQEKLDTLMSAVDIILIGEVVFVDKLISKEIRSVRNVCRILSKDECDDDVFCSSSGGCKLAIEKKTYKNFVKKIALDLINNNQILEGEVKKEILNKQNFINRKDEVILLSEADLIKYFT